MSDTQCTNPILPGFYPDPSICRVGQDYYLVNSTFCYFPGVPIFHSQDLVHWEQIGNVLNRRTQLELAGADHGGGIYAPTLRYFDGVFYMITTNVSHGGNFIVTATDPSGPWSEPYYLNTPGIDPSLFLDDDGRCYYCGTCDRREGTEFFGDNEIYIRELDRNTMQLKGPSYPAWHGALRHASWAEGPHLYKKDGYYYLLIAEGGTSWDHAVTIARSKSLTQPFEGCPKNPILTHRHLGSNAPVVYTGHADLIDTPDGLWYMVLLAVRHYGGTFGNLGRETFLAEVVWEDGWPVVNPGYGKLKTSFSVALAEKKSETVPELISFSTDQDEFTFPPPFVVLRNTEFSRFSWNHRHGCISLPLMDSMKGTGNPSALLERQTAFSYELETKVFFAPQQEGEEAGLVLYQSDRYHYRFCQTVEQETSIIQLIRCEDGVETVLAQKKLASCDTQGLILRITAKEQSLSFQYQDSPDSSGFLTLIDSVDGTILCTERAGGFVGTCLGIYAQSNVLNQPFQYADFEYLRLTNRNTETVKEEGL